jgi:hypothetical protein
MNRVISEPHAKIEADHLERMFYVYVRQSSPRQVQEHLESQRRQYELVDWAVAMGWPRERIVVIDEDQGKSGATAKTRSGFARLLAAVARGEVVMLRSAGLAIAPLAGYDPGTRVAVGAGVAVAGGFRPVCRCLTPHPSQSHPISLLGTLSEQVQPAHYCTDPPPVYPPERAIGGIRPFTSCK